MIIILECSLRYQASHEGATEIPSIGQQIMQVKAFGRNDFSSESKMMLDFYNVCINANNVCIKVNNVCINTNNICIKVNNVCINTNNVFMHIVYTFMHIIYAFMHTLFAYMHTWSTWIQMIIRILGYVFEHIYLNLHLYIFLLVIIVAIINNYNNLEQMASIIRFAVVRFCKQACVNCCF